MIEDSYVIAFGNGSSSSVFSDKFVCSVFVDYEFRNLPIMLFIFIHYIQKFVRLFLHSNSSNNIRCLWV